MRKIILTIAILCLIDSIHAQGIKFEHGLSWEEVEAKARAENKFIFMDFYATWCGPCKFMMDSIFSKKEVADYMAEYFICIAVQTDQTSKDPNDVRNWYDEAKSIIKLYSINELPTYLFFSPDGHPVDRMVGIPGKRINDFLVKASDALDPDKQYYTLLRNYKMHLQDSAFLRKVLISCLNLADNGNVEEVSDDYVNCLKSPYTIDDLKLLFQSVRSSKDKAFLVILNNAIMIDSSLHKNGYAERGIAQIITNEEILPCFSKSDSPIVWGKMVEGLKNKFPALNEVSIKLLFRAFENEILYKEIRKPLYKKGAEMADWMKISNRIKRFYPGYDPEKMIAKEKPGYYAYKKNWPICEKSLLSYISRYGKELDNSELNDMSWEYVFMHSTNRKLILKALGWSRRTIPDSSDETYHYSSTYESIDTYANLLYKAGYREQAIIWEKKALDLANRIFPDRAQVNYQITLKRMQAGEKTWVGRDEKSGDYQ
jgi:thiol-disulfide isomerase/thioredoxin